MRINLVLLWLICMLFDWCESTIRYFLYDGGTDTWNLLPSNGVISNPLWDVDSDVKVLIHGYNSKVKLVDREVLDRQFMTILAQGQDYGPLEYASYDNTINILVVDWKSLSTAPLHEYFSASKNVRPAGEQIANYLLSLLDNGYIPDLDSIHILGLSLGAHVAGTVGFNIQRQMNGEKLFRITGFDPAGPGFTTYDGRWPADMSIVLDYTDADFVDIIHTNVGSTGTAPIFSGALGTDLQTGHIDFYPNGGKKQNYQCNFLNDQFNTCSHQMSVLFYAQALRQPYKYLACPCDSYEKFLKGRCQCTHEGTGQLLGDLTIPGRDGRYYMTIKDPLSAHSFD